MTQQERIFITLSPTRLFFRCALPSMVSMAVTSLYTVVDGIFVGRYVGADALGLDGVWLISTSTGVLTAILSLLFLLRVLRQEKLLSRTA